MKWPLITPAIPRRDIPLYNLYYLHAPEAAQADPTIVWGTDIEMTGLREFLRHRNQSSPVLITAAHVLLWATARALVRHPEFNCRVVGRQIYRFRQLNLRMAMFNTQRGDVDVLLIEHADQLQLEEFAALVWHSLFVKNRDGLPIHRDVRRLRSLPAAVFDLLLRSYRWLDRRFPLPSVTRLDHLRSASVLVNDLSFRGAAPMRSYKPTRFPDETAALNITLGPMEEKAVVRNGECVASTVAPLFVRADHRIVDAYRLGQFVSGLRDLLQRPHQITGTPQTCNGGGQEARQPGPLAGVERPLSA